MSFEELKKSIDELQTSVHQFKQENDKEFAAIKSKGHADPLLTEKVDKINNAIDLALKRVEAVETAMNRKEVPADQKEAWEKATSPEHKAAFNKFIRKGDKRLTDAELKSMSVDSDPDGGFLVTPEMASEIVQKVFESSPIRQLASVMTISTDSVEMLQDLDEVDDSWVGETESREGEDDNPEFKMIKIPVHEQKSQPHATQKILDDAAFNVESWLSGKVAEKFARSEATAFVNGNGVLRPRGMLTYTAGTGYGEIEQIVSGSAAAFTADGLIDVVYALKDAYAKNASWLIKRESIKGIRKLKDSQNQYLWGVGLNGPASQALLGFPIYQAADVPVAAANALAAIFGDIKQAYQIVDRVGIRVLRDPYTKKGFVKFYTTKRVGGDVKNFEALKIQKLST